MSSCVSPVPRFASILNSDVKVKKITDQTYKITFLKVDPIIMYQVFTDQYPVLNFKRLTFNLFPKSWTELFNQNGVDPTSIMIVNEIFYGFVISKVTYTKDTMKWYVSTSPIVNKSTTIFTDLKTGLMNNVQFNVNNLTNIENPCPLSNEKHVNQLLYGDVRVEKINDGTFKITFSKSSMVSLYQVRSANESSRTLLSTTAKDWSNSFNNNQPFQPTTIMQHRNCNFIFVINSVQFINNSMVWFVKTSDIKNTYTIGLNKIKTGAYNNVLFDVDSLCSFFAGICGN